MRNDEIRELVRSRFEPITDWHGDRAYRCAVVLRDGLRLPCVVMKNAEAEVQLALQRFEETRGNGVTDPSMIHPGYYPTIVKSFVTTGNRLAVWDVEDLEPSPFALPLVRLAEIKGETSMSWTAFAGVMDDGREFSFGTTYTTEFFAMPEGYTADRVVRIIPHRSEEKPVYRERPFFTCFLDGL